MVFFLPWVAMASNINKDEFADVFGPAFAVSILTMIYGIGIKMVAYIMEEKIKLLGGE